MQNKRTLYSFAIVLMCLGDEAHATITVTSLTLSLPAPQSVGTTVTWTAAAADTNHALGPLSCHLLNPA